MDGGKTLRYDGGNCSSAIKEALTYVSPAEPYGASGEPEYPMHRGAKFFRRLLDADAPFVALENPAMHRYATAAIGGLRPSQYIHPFEHGHGETKSIGIYADGLPLLLASKLVMGRTHVRASLPQSPQRSAIRGRTYLGVAAAMAIQWTPVLAQHVATQSVAGTDAIDPAHATTPSLPSTSA